MKDITSEAPILKQPQPYLKWCVTTITRDCGILELIEPGDSIMADKGFDIAYDVVLRGANLNIPPFVKDRQQLS